MPEPISSLQTQAPKSTLLLVDDQPGNLVALEAVLAGSEYHLLMAHSGQEALDLLRENEVAVVLLDIQMPGMDGYETARRIKQIEGCQNVPIIFITAIFTENPYIKKGYEAGAIDYFTKPFDPDILKLKVQFYASFRQKVLLLKERELRLRESEEILKAGRKLAAVLEGLPVGVMIADAEGRICQTNDEVLRIWKSVETSAGDSYGEFLKWWSLDGQFIKAAVLRVLETGQSIHNRTDDIRCFDGALKTILSSVSPLRGLDNRVVGSVIVVQDITEHKKVEEDIEQRILNLISLGVGFEQSSR